METVKASVTGAQTTSRAAGRTIKTISRTLVLLQELEKGEAEEGADSLPTLDGAKESRGCRNQKRAGPGVSGSISIKWKYVSGEGIQTICLSPSGFG